MHDQNHIKFNVAYNLVTQKPTTVVTVSGKLVMTAGNTALSFGCHHVLCPMFFLDSKIRQQITWVVKLFSDRFLI
jgi:hypothetical protein